ncbi:MAG: DNA repair exonuclease, partial [Hyphomicrobiaceae bacterium]
MFVFLHTADWQLGKPFGAFPQEKAALLRDARLSSIDRLADAARRHDASHVVVAGDVFDGELVADGDIAKA